MGYQLEGTSGKTAPISQMGNPRIDDLAAIFDAARGRLKVSFDVRVVEVL